jgi:hypothetical protein
MLKKIAPFALVLALAACNAQTLAQTAQAIFVSVDAVLAIVDPSYDETQLIATSNAAVTALNAWTPGSESSEAVQALNDFKQVVSTITVIPAKYQDVIAVAVSGIDGILATLQSGTPSSNASPAAYKAAFNAKVAAHPELGQAKF